jgi:hypothetical protein
MKPATTWCSVEKRQRCWRHNLIDDLFPTLSPPFTIELAMTSDGKELCSSQIAKKQVLIDNEKMG